ncbi:MAG: hypothetical protein R3C14_43710 [Caldilineaceae bacterium]
MIVAKRRRLMFLANEKVNVWQSKKSTLWLIGKKKIIEKVNSWRSKKSTREDGHEGATFFFS